MHIQLPRWTPAIDGWHYRIHWKFLPSDQMAASFISAKWKGHTIHLLISYHYDRKKWWNFFLIFKERKLYLNVCGKTLEAVFKKMIADLKQKAT